MQTSRIRNLLMWPFAPLLSRLGNRPQGQRTFLLVAAAALAVLVGALLGMVNIIWPLALSIALLLPALPLLAYYVLSGDMLSDTPDRPLRIALNMLLCLSLCSQLATQFVMFGAVSLLVYSLLASWLLVTSVANAYLPKNG